jgi:hypothetical protein
MFFPNTSFYDGAVGVTQCGIPPQATFTYEVPVTNQPAGTCELLGLRTVV